MRRNLAVAVLAFTIACGDSTGPSAPSTIPEAVRLAAGLENTALAMQNPALRSLRALAIPAYLSSLSLWDISPFTLGKTFELDAQSGVFVAGTRSGASADGVRFLLYAVDSISGEVHVPLAEIGAVEMKPLTGVLGGPADSTHEIFTVMAGASLTDTVAVLRAHSTFNPGCLCATLEGWTRSAGHRVDFVLPYSIIFQGAATFSGSVTAGGFTASTGNQLIDSTVSVHVAVATSGDSVAIDGQSAQWTGPVHGAFTVRVGPRPFGTVSIGPSGETYAGPGGRAVTADERAAMHGLARAGLALGMYVEFPDLVLYFCGC